MPKLQLRRTLRAQRQQLSNTQQSHAAQQLAAHLSQLPWLDHTQHIGVYYPSDGEISPLFFIRQHPNKHFYLSSLALHEARTLIFHPWQPDEPLRYNHLQVAEPVQQNVTKPILELDMLLLPLVGFDRYGGRLGMGGGFYDYSLRNVSASSSKPRLVGIAHACQEVEKLPIDEWDIPLDAVVTDRDVLLFD